MPIDEVVKFCTDVAIVASTAAYMWMCFSIQVYTMLYAYKNEQRQVNKKFFELKKREYRDGIKMIGDKIGMACVHSRWRHVITKWK